MQRISNTSWFIDDNKVIKLCDKTVLKDANTILPIDRIKDFFYDKELEVGEVVTLNIEFMGKICETKIKKYNNKTQDNLSTYIYWKGRDIDTNIEDAESKYAIDKYLARLENIHIYDFRNLKGKIDIKEYTRMEFTKKNDNTIMLKIEDSSITDDFIFRKYIDKSTLIYGITIPKAHVEKVLNNTTSKVIERGQSQNITLIVDDNSFECRLANPDRKDTPHEVLQIRYDSNKELKKYLLNRFEYNEDDLKSNKVESKGHLDFYIKEEEDMFKVECHGEEDSMDCKIVIGDIHNYIDNQGYNYTHDQLSNLYLSLKTKPFVILAGISGTGKSKIVRLLAESLGATADNGQFNIISVKPDWNDGTEILGYKNLNDQFIEGHLTKIIKKAINNKNKPYFVCLDEMNLARVEYYLSDYLSIIESRKNNGQEITTDSLIEDTQNLYLPENLYLIGTVNMDDTTFTFSRKVLDRANTIEFSDVDLENLFNDNEQEIVEPLNITNTFLKTTYLKTMDIEVEYREYAKQINQKIIDINEILKKSQKQFAYRVRDEILFYMIENKKSEILDEDLAFDYQIMQKILPAINGSEGSIKDVLINLFNYICGIEVISDIDIEEAVNYLENETVRYKNSAEKIIYMLRGYDNDGYASYWY